MRAIADLHIHSKYSRATSISMDLSTLAFFGKMKGLDIIGTGDITHPKWFEEIKSNLTCDDESGLYKLREKPDQGLRFMITVELATVFSEANKARKVHHLILIPSLEVAAQVSDLLKDKGNLSVDGRPILNTSSPELVDKLMHASDMIEVIPAHVWTPWWSIFGSVSGYDSVEECYKDQTDHIHALETGLSSDPPMNWRLSQLDRYTLLSNSDCHSPQPYRLGREANVFQLTKLTYPEIIDAVRRKDPRRLIFTIETKPEYGKYHWTGHRDCGVSIPPSEALKLDNMCPKCGRKLTVGVEQRVEDLADRPIGFKPPNVPGFVYLLPLQEFISTALNGSTPSSKKVQQIYNLFIDAFGSEFAVLLDASIDAIAKIGGVGIANLIKAIRENTLKVTPGYDGVYGKMLFSGGEIKKEKAVKKRGLERWMGAPEEDA